MKNELFLGILFNVLEDFFHKPPFCICRNNK